MNIHEDNIIIKMDYAETDLNKLIKVRIKAKVEFDK